MCPDTGRRGWKGRSPFNRALPPKPHLSASGDSGAGGRARCGTEEIGHPGWRADRLRLVSAMQSFRSWEPLAVRPQVLLDAMPDARLKTLSGDHVGAVADPRFARSIVDFLT